MQKPFTFTVRPSNKGLNTSEPPQDIDMRESSNLINIRFAKGLTLFRSGFRLKYKGQGDNFLWLDLIYSLTESQVIGIAPNAIYALVGSAFELVTLYDHSTGAPKSYPYLSMEPFVQYVTVDAGFGQFEFTGANGGALFPGTDTYETITIFANGTSDGIIVIAYTAAGAEAETITGGIVPTLGRTATMYDGRIFIGGDENDNSKVTWSSKGLLSDWTLESGAGFTVIGDSPDWIQAMRKLGEYLIIYKERSIFIGSQTYLVDPPVRFDPAPGQGIGLAAPNSIGNLGSEHIFLGWDNVYVFSLSNLKPIGTQIKDDLFYGVNGILPKYLGNCTGVVAEEFDEYWLFVPSGKWPYREENNNEVGIINLHTDPLCGDTTLWSIIDGTMAEDTGVLGTKSIRITPTTDASVQLQWTSGGFAIGTYSITVWVKADSAITLSVEARGDSSALQGELDVSVTTEYQRFIFEFEVTSTQSAGQIRLKDSWAQNTSFNIDAIHLVRIDGVDSKYLINVDGHNTIGYIGPDNEPQEIPLITTKVGQWVPDTCWVYNYFDNAWSMWRIPMTGFGYDSIQTIISIADLTGTIAEQVWRFDEKRIVDFAPTNLLAQPDGQVYEAVSGETLDFGGVFDRAFVGYWESKDFDLKRPEIDKTLSRIIIYHETSHAPQSVDIGVSTDSGLTWEEQTVNIAQGHFSTQIDMFMTGPQVRFRMRSVSPGFFISGFSMKIIARGEANVY